MPSFATTALGPTSPLFRGRQADLARLIQLCQDDVGSYIVLYGGRQNGKTSLLLRLEAALAGQLHLCRIDFQLIKGATPAEAVAFLAAQLAQAMQLPSAGAVRDGPALHTYLEQALERPAVTRCVLLLTSGARCLRRPARRWPMSCARSSIHGWCGPRWPSSRCCSAAVSSCTIW